MNNLWQQTPTWQRSVFIGLAVMFVIVGIHAWLWSPLNQSIALITHDIAVLKQENEESSRKIALLKEVEHEVVQLREKLLPHLHQLSDKVEPQVYRRAIVEIGKRTGVTVRLWKPTHSVADGEIRKSPLAIEVKVEGKFYDTVQFLEGLLKEAWIETVNPLVLTRKHQAGDSAVVTTDFMIHGTGAIGLQQAKEALKT